MSPNQLKACLLRPLSELKFDSQDRRIRDAFEQGGFTHVAHLCATTEVEMLRCSNFGKKALDALKRTLERENLPPLGGVEFENPHDVQRMSFEDLQEYLDTTPVSLVEGVVLAPDEADIPFSSKNQRRIVSSVLPEKWMKLSHEFARAIKDEFAEDPEIKQKITELETRVLQVTKANLADWMLSDSFTRSSKSNKPVLDAPYTIDGWILKFIPPAIIQSFSPNFKQKASNNLIQNEGVVEQVQILEQCISTKLNARIAKEFN